MMSRIVLCLAAAAALATPAIAADRLNVGKAAQAAAPPLATNVGVQAGIFAKHGLDVEVSDFSGGGKMHQAMAAGSLDLAVGAGPEMALIAKGSPEIAICNSFPPANFIVIMVPGDSTVKTVADLKGKRVGVSSVGGLTYWLALELARTQGWGPDGINIVTIGNGDANIVAAFKTHAVDADIGPSGIAENMEEDHSGRLLVPVTKFEGNLGAGMIFATKKAVAEKPDVLRRFIAAWFDTVDFMRKHKDETVKIEAGVTGYSPAVQAKEYDLNMSGFSDTCQFDADSMSNLKRSFVDLKLVETVPDMKTLYTEEFLPKR